MLFGILRSFLVLNYSALCSLVLAMSWGAIMEHAHEVRLRTDPAKRSRLVLGWAIFACCALDTLIFGQDSIFTMRGHLWDTSRHQRTAQPVLSVPQSVQELAACALLLSMHDLEQVFFAGCFLWTAHHLGAEVEAMTPIFLKAAALLAIFAAPAGAAVQLAWRLLPRWRSLVFTNPAWEEEKDEREERDEREEEEESLEGSFERGRTRQYTQAGGNEASGGAAAETGVGKARASMPLR